MRTTIFIAAVLAISAAFYFTSCSLDTPSTPTLNDTVNIGGTGSNCVTIYGGQTIDVGDLCFTDVDTDNNGYDDLLKVCYNTTDGWELTEIHFWIGNSQSEFPVNNGGNPVPGQFPYSYSNLNGVTTYCIDIPFSSIGITCPGGPFTKYYAAHCVVRKLVNGSWQTQTGWGYGPRFTPRGNWGMWNTFVLTCDSQNPDPPPTPSCETGYAYGNTYATCFIGNFEGAPYNLNTNNWGWTNGPLAAGTYTFDIYAGAGQCSLAAGTVVGNLTVNYNGTSATVTYNMNSGFTLNETQLYVGSTPLYYKCNGPNCGYTIAPGQYPNKHTLSSAVSDSYTVNGLSGNIYVVAHAVVCGNY